MSIYEEDGRPRLSRPTAVPAAAKRAKGPSAITGETLVFRF
jgi:hypothetical protein